LQSGGRALFAGGGNGPIAVQAADRAVYFDQKLPHQTTGANVLRYVRARRLAAS